MPGRRGGCRLTFVAASPSPRQPQQALDLRDENVPLLGVILVNPIAEVPQDLGGSAFSDPDVHGSLIELGFGRRQPGHRREEGYLYEGSLLRDRHSIWSSPFTQTKRPTVE